jgi:hypothetical protein
LAYNEVTDTSVILTWEGTTDSYEIEIGGTTKAVGTDIVTINGLLQDTEYTWKVRAIEGELTSEWVDGPTFTTELREIPANIEFQYVLGAEYDADYFDDAAGTDTSNFFLAFSTNDYSGTDFSGWYMSLDLCSSQILEWPGDTSYQIPPGRYEISTEVAPDHCVLGAEQYTRIAETNEGGSYVEPTPEITGGDVIIIGNSDNYEITATFNLADGRTVTGTYSGPIPIAIPPAKPDLGQFIKGEVMIFGEGSFRLSLFDDKYVDTGIGYELQIDICATPDSSEPIIPDGTYTVGWSETWSVNPGNTSLALRREAGMEHDFIVNNGGTVTTRMTSENVYNIDIDLLTEGGVAIQRTYSGLVAPLVFGAPTSLKSATGNNYSSKFNR